MHARALAEFDCLVELTEPERAARLSQLQSSDPELAADLIKLLRADADPSGVLDRGVEAIVDVDVDVPDPAPTAVAHARVGAFTLVRPIGRGGMGEVWLAERRDGAFVQQVALKLLKRGMDSDALTARFVRERRILAELNHPHIARFIDGGVSDDGRLYYAMDYVDGVDLLAHAQQQRLDVRERVRLLVDVCEAVAHAQARLVVHRDLKPSNILVDLNGQPRVLDFGIAKLLGDSASGEALTLTGSFLMSPQYAAPEQILGEPISTSTDVYALGTILFELLTGERPQQRQSTSLQAMSLQVRTEQAVAPSTLLRRGSAAIHHTDTARARREISGDLDTIVLTALQREPARRYANAAALADDLRRWLSARPVAAQPDSGAYRLRLFVARNRLAVGSAGAVFLALLAGLGVALWQASVARQQAERAEREGSAAREAQRQAQRVNAFFSVRIENANVTQQGAGAALTFKDWLLESIERLDEDLADAPSGRANVRREFAQSLRELGEFGAAVKQGEIAITEARTIFGPSLETALALQSHGVTLNEQGDHDAAQRALEEHLGMLDALPVSDEVRDLRVTGRTTLMRIAGSRGDYARALEIAQQNVDERTTLYGADSFRLAVDYNNLSAFLMRLGRLEEAERATVRARELLQKDPGHPVARVAYLDQALCSLRILRGDGSAAIEMCRRAVALSEKVVGPDNPQTLSQRITLSLALLSAGQVADADREMNALMPTIRARQIRELDDALTMAARIQMRRQQWHQALRLADEAAALHEARGVKEGISVDRTQLIIALATHALRPTAATLAALRSRAAPVIARTTEPGVIRAFAALCVHQGLLASGQEAEADSMRKQAIELMLHDMDAATAERQWANWTGTAP